MRREARENKRKLLIRRLLFGLVLLFAAGIGAVFGVNAYVQASVQDRICLLYTSTGCCCKSSAVPWYVSKPLEENRRIM